MSLIQRIRFNKSDTWKPLDWLRADSINIIVLLIIILRSNWSLWYVGFLKCSNIYWLHQSYTNILFPGKQWFYHSSRGLEADSRRDLNLSLAHTNGEFHRRERSGSLSVAGDRTMLSKRQLRRRVGAEPPRLCYIPRWVVEEEEEFKSHSQILLVVSFLSTVVWMP